MSETRNYDSMRMFNANLSMKKMNNMKYIYIYIYDI